MTDTHCLHQRGQAEAVADIGICMHIEQPTDNLQVAMGGRDVECRPSVVVGLVQVLARIVQRLQNHDRSGGGGATDQHGFLRFLVLGKALGIALPSTELLGLDAPALLSAAIVSELPFSNDSSRTE